MPKEEQNRADDPTSYQASRKDVVPEITTSPADQEPPTVSSHVEDLEKDLVRLSVGQSHGADCTSATQNDIEAGHSIKTTGLPEQTIGEA